MNKNTTQKKNQDDTRKDLHRHGVQDIIPANEEYYTLDLTRGRTRPSENDVSAVDVASSDPYDNLDTQEPSQAMPHNASTDDSQFVTQVRTDQPSSSNDGGPVLQQDLLDQDSEQGYATGEPGDSRVDDQTG
jgi:hypothetical protein